MIPEQLQEEGFRFIRIAPRDKRPVDKGWQSGNSYAYDTHTLKSWLDNGGNIGFVTGTKNVCVLDFDCVKFYNKVQNNLPKTFTILSGSCKPHLYYVIKDAKNFSIPGKLDFQAQGRQVIIPPSKHPNGNPYQVLRDVPIFYWNYEDMKSIIDDFLSKEDKIPLTNVYIGSETKDKIAKDIKERITIEHVLELFGVPLVGYRAPCPLCKSNNNRCFSVDSTRQLFHCFKCNATGDVIELYMRLCDVTFPQAKEEMGGIKVDK